MYYLLIDNQKYTELVYSSSKLVLFFNYSYEYSTKMIPKIETLIQIKTTMNVHNYINNNNNMTNLTNETCPLIPPNLGNTK